MSTNTFKTLPLPSWFEESKVGTVWPEDYGIQEEAFKRKEKLGIPNSAEDKRSLALVQIDNQIDFVMAPPWGRLSVAGAIDDSIRLCKFMYQNEHIITKHMYTLDTHSIWQIFFPIFLLNKKTKKTIPIGTMVTHEDIKNGEWEVNPVAAYALGQANAYPFLMKHLSYYTKELDTSAKDALHDRQSLITWPYHTILGSTGHSLVPSIMEAIFSHSIVRGSGANCLTKGSSPLSEAYSPISLEVPNDLNGKPFDAGTAPFVEALIKNDVVVVAGQAKSHCLACFLADLLTKYPDLAQKVYVLEDCTSPVVIPGLDFTDAANKKFEQFKAHGLNVVKSTTPIGEWPGIAGQIYG